MTFGEIFEKALELQTLYKNAKPFEHVVISNVFEESLLFNVKQELFQIQKTKKETDIYKVFQTGDFANIDGLDHSEKASLKNILHLRNAIYSQEFRSFVEKVIGSEPLSIVKKDLSHNEYRKGGHLLCHDDVIGSRVVSFILYLCDEDWSESDGGGLELFQISGDSPLPDPAKIIPPRWNQMVFFKVQPGVSYHSVQEVFSDRSRPSISGWFHSLQPGETSSSLRIPETANASRSQLLAPVPRPFTTFKNSLGNLNENDIVVLKEFINPVYLSSSIISQIRARFESEFSIELYSFLRKELWRHIQSVTVNNEVTCDWKTVAFPQYQRYQSPVVFDQEPAASLKKISNFFSCDSFRKFLVAVTGLELLGFACELRRFRPGSDYTLAMPASRNSLDVTFCIVLDDESWTNDEVGGFDCYMAPDEGNDDPAQYRGDSDNELLSVSARGNSLSLVFRDSGVLRFIKYISAQAKSSRWDISAEFVAK